MVGASNTSKDQYNRCILSPFRAHIDVINILADDIFKCIFLKEKFRIFIETSQKIVPKGLITNNQALV